MTRERECLAAACEFVKFARLYGTARRHAFFAAAREHGCSERLSSTHLPEWESEFANWVSRRLADPEFMSDWQTSSADEKSEMFAAEKAQQEGEDYYRKKVSSLWQERRELKQRNARGYKQNAFIAAVLRSLLKGGGSAGALATLFFGLSQNHHMLVITIIGTLILCAVLIKLIWWAENKKHIFAVGMENDLHLHVPGQRPFELDSTLLQIQLGFEQELTKIQVEEDNSKAAEEFSSKRRRGEDWHTHAEPEEEEEEEDDDEEDH